MPWRQECIYPASGYGLVPLRKARIYPYAPKHVDPAPVLAAQSLTAVAQSISGSCTNLVRGRTRPAWAAKPPAITVTKDGDPLHQGPGVSRWI